MKTVYLSVPLPNYRAAFELLGAGIADTPEHADMLLLPGGGDIHPKFYHQLLAGADNVDEARDCREFALLRQFLAAERPVFGICRGLQVINVAFGGTLQQHIDGHSQVSGADQLHRVRTESSILRTQYGAQCIVNSAHHQAVHRLGKGLCAIQYADDGTIEAIAHAALPILAVQWHPERLCGDFSRPDAADGSQILAAFLQCF